MTYRLLGSFGFAIGAIAWGIAGCGGGAQGGIGPVDEAHGVFIDAAGGSDTTGDGSRQHPYATFAKGVQAAAPAGKHLFACAGTYPEHVRLDSGDDGLLIAGGFSCADWAEGGGDTDVVPGDAQPALRVDGAKNVSVHDVVFETADATDPGESSVAAQIDDSMGIDLETVTLRAGQGADGADIPAFAHRAMDGTPGNDGADACTANPNPGGPEVVTDCGSEMSTGGNGGAGGVGVAGSAQSGNNGFPDLGVDDLGVAGFGQISDSFTCDVGGTGGGGQIGASGADGMLGDGAVGPGSLDAGGFVGEAGQDGKPGHAGQGGGGGGGAKAPGSDTQLVCTLIGANVGASGGSGGGGGCGGQGGAGGGGGGASIALISVDSDVRVEDGMLEAAKAGDGGQGGLGQSHGSGGLWGEGGSGLSAHNGCQGGQGGEGGNGGNGGGGAGGPSLGIAYTGAMPVVGNVTFSEASAVASGGLGGSYPGAMNVPNSGADGIVADVQAFSG